VSSIKTSLSVTAPATPKPNPYHKPNPNHNPNPDPNLTLTLSIRKVITEGEETTANANVYRNSYFEQKF